MAFQFDFSTEEPTSVERTPDRVRRKRSEKIRDTQLRKAKDAESALEEIQTEKFYNTLKSYYSYRENDNSFLDKSHADLLEYFYTDRSWRNNNTVSMGMDMANAISEDDPERLKEFAYIQQTYNMLPSFWNDPNRSFGSWLIDNGGAMIADPINLVGFGVGGQTAKQAYKETLKQAIKGKIAGELTEQSVLLAAKEAEKKALGQAIKKGALYEGAIGAGTTLAQDAMLQTTAIQTGVQDEFDLKQSAISTAAGFGFGTVFGAGFSYGGFKLTNRSLKNTSVKQLKDLQDYGRDTITGKRLFEDLYIKKDKNVYYQNLSKENIDRIEAKSSLIGDTTDVRIKNLRETADAGISTKDKPPLTPFNYTRYKRGAALTYLKNQANEWSENIGTDKMSFKQIDELAEKIGADPKKLRKLAKSKSKEDRDVASLVVAHGNSMIKESEDIVKLSNELNRVDLKPKEKEAIIKELELRNEVLTELMDVQKSLQENYARATAAGRIVKDQDKAISLILEPEDIKMKQLKEGDPEAFWKAVSLLDDDTQVILALQNARKVNKWDLAAEYVNNNLLSSPDTHILNIISGLTQTQWKPFVMLLRSANLAFKDKARAKIVAREALQTYIYQYTFIAHSLKRALKSFYLGRPILDSKQMKYDANIKQGQLQRFINETGLLLTEPLGVVGRGLQKGVVQPTAYITSLPMRVLSAGDEFLKTMMFKSRMAATIQSRILDETPDIGIYGRKNRLEYKKRFKELEQEYLDTNGAAKETDGTVTSNLNDPLQYAREGSYTQSAYSINPKTGKREGKITGGILSFTNQHRWLRVAGLHFINTPSNLLRWNFQHLPLLGRFQFQMRHMLAKGSDGKYLNPEAAAEANARIQAGWLLWSAAIFAAINGKVTGGGSRDWKENRERERTTGWQQYSINDEGRYISANRLDPIMFPFFVAADFVDAINDFLKHNEDLPEEVENQYTELAMGVVASLTRNLTSKFYTKNILETANFFFSDDFMKSRAPDRIGSSILARGIFKMTPLSGGLRYTSRVTDDYQRELFTFSDRLRTLNPFSDKDRTMPERNMFGEKIDRKNGWLFGLGGKTGLWSSPFAMTNFKNNETTKFFQDRELNYKAPQKVDRYTNIDLRTIKNNDGQTAYDRWLELKSEVDIPYKGKKYKLKDLIEEMVKDKTSKLYRLPEGIVAGDDYRQKFILDIVHKVERTAFKEMWKEFPILQETLKKRDLFIREKAESALSEFMEAIE